MDIVTYINDNEHIRALIRAARDGKVSDEDILRLVNKAKRTAKKK